MKKHPALIIRSTEPFNAGPPPDLMIREPVTRAELFFVRNHGTVPEIDADSFRLIVRGRVERPLSLSLDDLRLLPERTVAATLQCAGNRRRELLRVGDIPNEVPWDIEAISHAEWTGVSLRDVLELAGIGDGAAYVALTSLDKVERRGRVFGFGASIPLAKALRPEVLLAYGMNGEPLPLIHGAPLRLVVPGFIGARSVKWLGEIVLQDEPSGNYFQSVAYRLFPPHVDETTAVEDQGEMLSELFVSAAICSPLDGDSLPDGEITVRGYAVGQGGNLVERVEVSADDGATWVRATPLNRPQPWVWQLWEARIALSPGDRTIIARTIDSQGLTQPADMHETWNFKGYMNNAWHRIEVRVEK